MYILYLDESGDPNSWQDQKNFVIAGVAVYEGQIETIGEKLRAIQQKYFPNISVPIEFHATDIRNGKGAFRDFHPIVREKILEDICGVITDNRYPSLIIFGAVLSIDAAQNPNQARSVVFEEVCCGLNSFLVLQHKLQRTTKGLLIIDRYREDYYKQLLSTFRQNGTKYGYLGNIVDIPYFARCRETPMLQLADMVSYALYRYYEKKDDRYLKMILPRIYKTLDGKMFGLKHITKVKPCDCISCVTQQTIIPP
jgi:hypothetical protein